LRPDTYIGSIERETRMLWVYENDKMVYKNITITPGLYKIFDEILVNAADNSVRCKNQTEIKVDINKNEGYISVYNDGDGIPIVMHNEHKIYIPEMIFGHLLTGSNFDDDEKKTVGGRNGYGAKLANIYSTKFICETVNASKKKQFIMEWTNNMHNNNGHKISDCNIKRDYTKITFYPDLKRFNMTEFDDDILSLFYKRVYDIAGCTNKKLKV